MTDRRDFLKTAALAGVGLGLGACTSGGAASAGAAAPLRNAPPGPGLFTAPPLERVRVGFVGVGHQGTAHVQNFLRIDGVDIVAICDVTSANLARSQKLVADAGRPRPTGYGERGPRDFERMIGEEKLDLVFTATPWEWHAPVMLAAMRAGSHAATEVPMGVTLEECWELVETAERTQRHCVMMENCCYDRPEMMILNMHRQGLFGELLHAECGYLHDLRPLKLSDFYYDRWRVRHAITRNGDLYPIAAHRLSRHAPSVLDLPRCHGTALRAVHRTDKRAAKRRALAHRWKQHRCSAHARNLCRFTPASNGATGVLCTGASAARRARVGPHREKSLMPLSHPCVACLPSGIQRAAQSILMLLSLACASHEAESVGSNDSAVARPDSAAAKAVGVLPADTLWLLAPDSTGDAIRAADTEASLVARYGAENVTREGVDQGEGMLVPGTVLFARDSLRRLEIQWGDTLAYSQPLIVTAVGSSWMVAPGIGLGTTLRELEQLNGGPFELRGFRGHYPGRITSWGGGLLSPFDKVNEDGYARVKLHLQPATPYQPGADTRPYSAEKRYPSSDAGIQRLNPRVVLVEVHPR